VASGASSRVRGLAVGLLKKNMFALFSHASMGQNWDAIFTHFKKLGWLLKYAEIGL